MKKQAAKKTADAATTEAPKLPKTAKRLKAKKAIKEKALEAPESAPQVIEAPAREVKPTPAPKAKKVEPKKKEAPILLPEAERRELRQTLMPECAGLRKEQLTATGKRLEKVVLRLREISRVYREQNLVEFSARRRT